MNKNPITVKATVNAPIEKVWSYWTEPHHVEKWAFASDDWEAKNATNDISSGGRFSTRMSAKDGSSHFDFEGIYTMVEPYLKIEYDMDKDVNDEKPRHVSITFTKTQEGVEITQTFDPEQENTAQLQREGWQSILNNFKKYAEKSS